MGIGKKMSKGSIGGGVNISHKSKMSQSAKNQMSAETFCCCHNLKREETGRLINFQIATTTKFS